MKQNMGSIDRIIRVVVAVLLVVLALTGVLSGALAVIAYVLAAVFLLTSLVGFCPLYAPFKINTLRS
jgi:K+-transporting ATPase A subunit